MIQSLIVVNEPTDGNNYQPLSQTEETAIANEKNTKTKKTGFLEAHSLAIKSLLTSLNVIWYVSFMVNIENQKSVSKNLTIQSNGQTAAQYSLTANIAGAFAMAAGVFLTARSLYQLMKKKGNLTPSEQAQKKTYASEIVATLTLYGAYFLNTFKQKEVASLFVSATSAMNFSMGSGIFIAGNIFFMATTAYRYHQGQKELSDLCNSQEITAILSKTSPKDTFNYDYESLKTTNEKIDYLERALGFKQSNVKSTTSNIDDLQNQLDNNPQLKKELTKNYLKIKNQQFNQKRERNNFLYLSATLPLTIFLGVFPPGFVATVVVLTTMMVSKFAFDYFQNKKNAKEINEIKESIIDPAENRESLSDVTSVEINEIKESIDDPAETKKSFASKLAAKWNAFKKQNESNTPVKDNSESSHVQRKKIKEDIFNPTVPKETLTSRTSSKWSTSEQEVSQVTHAQSSNEGTMDSHYHDNNKDSLLFRSSSRGSTFNTELNNRASEQQGRLSHNKQTSNAKLEDSFTQGRENGRNLFRK